MKENNRTVGTLFLQIALGLLFVVSGIWTVQEQTEMMLPMQ